jgi:hypothetical protein
MTPEEQAAADAAVTAKAAADKVAADAAAEKAKQDAAVKPPWGDSTEFNPEKAWTLIQNLREESKTTKAAAEKAVSDGVAKARQDLTDGLAKALGLKTDDSLDPAKLQEELAKSQVQSRQSTVELAVFRTADAAGANPAALLDSRSFLSSIEGVDPYNTDALKAAIATAITENPLLAKVVDVSKTGPRPFPGQGGSSNGTPSLSEQIALAEKAGDTRLVIKLKSAQALQPQ